LELSGTARRHRLRERQVSQFVEDHQIQLPLLAGSRVLFEGVDQPDGREEAYPPMAVLDRLHADRGGEVGLSCAERLGRAFQQLVLPRRDLVRVDIKLFGKLRRGILVVDGRQRHLGLEFQ